ncbi:MAG: glycosyltransferase family 2 protein [Lachnospiraceae bacterium]|nr:glycosyltransferase family 2 protein [Lachnospiraceae bacterium]
MKLSIIVPVYNMNHEGNLQFCLDSLVNQTIEDYEIIAVDDASTDDSLAVLRDYEKKYPNLFKVITYPNNRHQGGAKNEGLKIATGEWIGFIDSDDWVTADYYEKLICKADQTCADMVGCTYCFVSHHTYEATSPIHNNSSEQSGILDDAKMKDLIRHPGSMVIKIYKHSIIKENDLSFPENMFYEDNCAARVWMPYFKHFEYIDEPMYYYLQQDTSTVHTVTEARCNDRVNALNLMLEEFSKREMFDKYYEELEDVYTQLGFRITLFSYMLGCKNKKYAYVKKLKREFLLRFPEFRNNKYYSIQDKEEEKMIILCMKNSFVFYIYYSLLWKYRNIKKRN